MRTRRCGPRSAPRSRFRSTCTDLDEDALELSIVDGPSNGSLGAIEDGEVTYTPDAGEFGDDSFTYRATDGTSDSEPATVDVTITRPPICEDVEETALVGSSVSVPLTCTDPDGDAARRSRSPTARRRAAWARSPASP